MAINPFTRGLLIAIVVLQCVLDICVAIELAVIESSLKNVWISVAKLWLAGPC